MPECPILIVFFSQNLEISNFAALIFLTICAGCRTGMWISMSGNVTMLIFSCDKFSDLWDAHVHQLEKYWPDRAMKTYIVTDKENSKTYENVEILSAGETADFTERLQYALDRIDTDFVFVTLDDYFLIKQVNNEEIDELVAIMSEKELDYIRLFRYTKRADAGFMEDYPYLINVDTSVVYSVNLYPGIWTRDFLACTAKERKNPWQYEVSLSRVAQDYKAKCAASVRNEFVILDVVRKGKILNSANRFIKKHDIPYYGDRPIHSHLYELRDNFRNVCISAMPKPVFYFVRNILIKMGFHFYSQDV